jgi:hypothetical protein
VSDDPYVYPGTEVLRNMPGIRDACELQRFEARLTFLRGLQLLHEPIAEEYDLHIFEPSTSIYSPGFTSGQAG